MKAASPQTRQRVLALAEELGNVSEACRRCGVTRTQYYQYRRNWLDRGAQGLVARKPVPKNRPHAIGSELRERIVEQALQHPHASGAALQAFFAQEGISISSVTLLKHLASLGLASKEQRWLALERLSEDGATLTGRQTEFVEAYNPCFRLHGAMCTAPAQLMFQDCFAIGTQGGPLRFVHCVVDAYSMYAFAQIYAVKNPEAAVVLLHQDVIPALESSSLSLQTIVTDQGRIFGGKASHLYRVYLQLNGIDHVCRSRVTEGMGPTTRFVEIVRRDIRLGALSTSLEIQQSSFTAWLEQYNRSPLPGYPCHGASPGELFHSSRA